jgi:hypothetical protein
LAKPRVSLYKSLYEQTRVSNDSNSVRAVRPGGAKLIAAAVLLAALAVVVLYTGRAALLSPLALVVIAAIGMVALLLQLRLRPDFSKPVARRSSVRVSLGMNAAGVLFAVGAIFGDVLGLKPTLLLIAALAAVGCFAVSAVVVLNELRRGAKRAADSANS